jgi:manganese/zinc/iron transport system substrate-binding protein
MTPAIRLIPLIAVGICLFGGCFPVHQPDSADADSGRPLRVVATVGMVADLVRQIGGPHVEVRQLMGNGVDPHLYKVTRDDVRAIFAADLIFASGLMLEGKMSHTLGQMARRRPVVSVADTLMDSGLIIPGDAASHGHPDPHVWMDVSLWAQTLPIIVQSLSKLRPEAHDDFLANSLALRDEMISLHAYGVESIGSIPEGSRQLITSHDAFGYFGRAYGMDVTGVQGLATDSEAGLLRINDLVDLIVRRQISAVFVESSVPWKSLEAVVEGVTSRGHQVTIGGELFSDSCGPSGTYEGTYLGMMDHNLTLITRALGGIAPPGGFRGRLSLTDPERTDPELTEATP